MTNEEVQGSEAALEGDLDEAGAAPKADRTPGDNDTRTEAAAVESRVPQSRNSWILLCRTWL